MSKPRSSKPKMVKKPKRRCSCLDATEYGLLELTKSKSFRPILSMGSNSTKPGITTIGGSDD